MLNNQIHLHWQPPSTAVISDFLGPESKHLFCYLSVQGPSILYHDFLLY